MSEAKRFYWLKLKHDFFKKNIYMKKLRRMENGTELAFLYLELLTYALEDDGVLTFQGVEDSLGEELALDLDEDPELMVPLIDFLLKYELLVEQEDGTYLLVEVLESTGSETRQAEYNRIRRAKDKKTNIVTQEGNNVTPCYTEGKQCFLEKREKSKEIREEVEVRDPQPPQETNGQPIGNQMTTKEPQEKVTAFVDYQKFVDLYNEKCPSLPRMKALTSDRKQRLKALLSTYKQEDLILVFEKAEKSARLRGELNGKGYEDFIADFDWITNQDNFVKILEGKYDSRGQPGDPEGIYAALEADLLDNY